jgi:hypothetical protein
MIADLQQTERFTRLYKERINELGKYVASPEFQKLMLEIAAANETEIRNYKSAKKYSRSTNTRLYNQRRRQMPLRKGIYRRR